MYQSPLIFFYWSHRYLLYLNQSISNIKVSRRKHPLELPPHALHNFSLPLATEMNPVWVPVILLPYVFHGRYRKLLCHTVANGVCHHCEARPIESGVLKRPPLTYVCNYHCRNAPVSNPTTQVHYVPPFLCGFTLVEMLFPPNTISPHPGTTPAFAPIAPHSISWPSSGPVQKKMIMARKNLGWHEKPVRK